jgi:hypothetical protein
MCETSLVWPLQSDAPALARFVRFVAAQVALPPPPGAPAAPS